MESRVNALQCESVAIPDLRYFIGREMRRFWIFGKPVLRWHECPRDFFYDAMRAANLLSANTQPSTCDVLLLAGDVFRAGPYHFRGTAK